MKGLKVPMGNLTRLQIAADLLGSQLFTNKSKFERGYGSLDEMCAVALYAADGLITQNIELDKGEPSTAKRQPFWDGDAP